MQLPNQPADLYEYQRIARKAGYRNVVGVDEAGRGPLAGPVTAAAVRMSDDKTLPGVNDSKQLTEKQREELFCIITADPDIHWSVICISPPRIDEINILQATHEAMRAAVAGLPFTPDLIFVDGNPVHGFECPARNVVKGDAKCASIAAASIIAKVHRDRLMVEYDEKYPGYGFAAHKGYGTAAHLKALHELGPTPIHRQSFAPVTRILNEAKQDELDLFG